MRATVNVKERITSVPPGGGAMSTAYSDRPALTFQVEADVPSELRKAAKEVFLEHYADTYRVLACTTPATGRVLLVVTSQPRGPRMRPGMVYKRPRASR